MTYVVKEECIKCKLMDCIEHCPTDCFHEGENMLVINPEPCIDCGVCVSECPVDAIVGQLNPEDDLTTEERYWLELNEKYSEIWPVVTQKGNPPSDAEDWKTVEDKRKYFSSKPGDGDD